MYLSKYLIKKAETVYLENFPKTANFERAVFFSWGCSIGDCGFCYMSTQPKDKPLKETKRSTASILAEFILAKNLNWDIGFFTGGIGILTPNELEELLKIINEVTKEKIWLSIGPINKSLLEKYKPYIKGIVGSIETVDPILHKKVCPSKPLLPYEKMFEAAISLNIDRAITFIVGLGEIEEDIVLLKNFIKKYNISKIHIYSLIPTKGTMFENASIPSKEEQAWWIANLRISFPKLDIQCGIWEDRADRIAFLLKAGSNSFSKFKAIKLFGSKIAEEVETQCHLAGREFKGALTKLPNTDWNNKIDKLSFSKELKDKIKEKLEIYLKQMNKKLVAI